ncbi:MAG: 2-hydroxyacyl-CoA dehydratase subunit D [Caldisericia bacterium]
MHNGDIKDLYEEILTKKIKDEKSFFYFCSYVPVEIIHASSYKPVRFILDSMQFLHSDEVIPKYICPYLKTAVEFFIKNNLKEKNIIFTDGCDSSRRIFEVFKELNFTKKYFYLKIPFNENPQDVLFFKSELQKLFLLLNGKIDLEKLNESINLYNSGRKKLYQIFNNKSQNLKSSFKFYLNSLFQLMDIEDFINLDIDFTNQKNEIQNKFYLFSTVYPLNFIEYIESLGINIEYDDSCFGEKNLSLIELNKDDPLTSISEYYLKREGCVRKREIDKKLENLIQRYKNKNLKGVIIYNLKYCDPLIFFIPMIKEKLNEEKIPLLMIEDDFTMNIKGQIRTRIEAFLEMMI